MYLLKIKIALILIVFSFLTGCLDNGATDEARKLGFSNVDEMNEIQAKGWHSKKKYIEDEIKRVDFETSSTSYKNKPPIDDNSKFNNELLISILEKAAAEVCDSSLSAADVEKFEEFSSIKSGGVGGFVSYCYGVIDKVLEIKDKREGKISESLNQPSLIKYLAACDKTNEDEVRHKFNSGYSRLLICATIGKDKKNYCQEMVNSCQNFVIPIMKRFNLAGDEFKSQRK
jgi:hypothetical protein